MSRGYSSGKRRLPACAPQTKGPLIIQQRQTNRKTAADLRRALDLNRAVVIFDHLLGDVEPEAGAALALLGREIGIENFRHLRRRNSVAGILDPDIDVKILSQAVHRNGALFLAGRLDR